MKKHIRLKSVLFEMPHDISQRTGEPIGKCTSFGKEYGKEK